MAAPKKPRIQLDHDDLFDPDEGMEEEKPTKYPSRHMIGERPVVIYQTAEERERGDKLYSVRIFNTHLGRREGMDSLGVNGRLRQFPLGAKTELYGFEINQLRDSKYSAPVIEEIDGMVKLKGFEQRNVYSVDVDLDSI